jgi:hypothetical protein
MKWFGRTTLSLLKDLSSVWLCKYFRVLGILKDCFY